MAIMKGTRSIRSSPGGSMIGVEAVAGAKVEVLETQLPWSKIRLLDGSNTEGWVSDAAIDKDVDSLGPLDRDLVARTCVERAASFGSNTYYLMTVAQWRTNVIDIPEDSPSGTGIYGFSREEWRLNKSHPEYGVNYGDETISDWRAQCTLFAIMSAKRQISLAEGLQQQPTIAELFLAQTIGTGAAVDAIKSPGTPLPDILQRASQEAAVEMIDTDNFTGRDKVFLVGADGRELMRDLAPKLQAALDQVRPLVRKQADEFMKTSLELGMLAPANIAQIQYGSTEIPAERRRYAELIATQFAEHGYGAVQQIAAVANAIGESRLNPSASNLAGERSFGLFQLNQNGGVGTGYSEAELTDPEKNIAIMLAEIAKPYQKRARAAFIAAANLYEAVKIFVYEFERPADKQGDTEKRYKIAQRLVA
ncbi:MAG: phage tail tip lysozyme [Rhizobiaceae bacterium]